MNLFLVEAAKKLGSDKEIMDSYWRYHEGEQNWFFSPNPNLKSATPKPHNFPSSDSWKKKTQEERKQVWNHKLSSNQRMTISELAGFGWEGRGINLNSSAHFTRLTQGLMNWRSDLYSVFWGKGNDGKMWLCNVFVGDAIYLCAKKNFTTEGRHYFDPKQIYLGKSFLRKIDSYKNVKAGDICVFGMGHVEIITKIQPKEYIKDDGFCSIGAGRGGNRGDMGLIKCDSFFSLGTRELDNNKHTYFKL